MLDIRFIRNNLSAVEEALAKRRSNLDLSEYRALDEERRRKVQEVEDLKAERNRASAEVAKKKKAGEDASGLIEELGELSSKIKGLDRELKEVEEKVRAWVMAIPNIPHESVPHGETDEDNREERRFGKIPEFDFTPKAHWELGPDLNGLDFERAAKIAGSRFVLVLFIQKLPDAQPVDLAHDKIKISHGFGPVLLGQVHIAVALV